MPAGVGVARLSDKDMLANLLEFGFQGGRGDASSCCTRFREDLVDRIRKTGMTAPSRDGPSAFEAFAGSQCGW